MKIILAIIALLCAPALAAEPCGAELSRRIDAYISAVNHSRDYDGGWTAEQDALFDERDAALLAAIIDLLPCTEHSCSDDSAVPPVAGNEDSSLTLTDPENIGRIDLTVDGGATVCASYAPKRSSAENKPRRTFAEQSTMLPAWPVCYPPVGVRVYVQARACDRDGLCSSWTSTRVEYEGQEYMCFDGAVGGQVPCNFRGGTR